MGLLRNFTPDVMRDNVYCYTPEIFKKLGVDIVVFDIDNTIAPYEMHEPTEEVKAYFASLKEAGIEAMLVSNNGPERVERFNRELGLFAVPDAKKPSPAGINKCLEQSKNKGDAVFVGDQIFTDCLAARRAGIKCFLVSPIQPKENLFFKLKRLGERPFVRRYKRKTAKNGDLIEMQD